MSKARRRTTKRTKCGSSRMPTPYANGAKTDLKARGLKLSSWKNGKRRPVKTGSGQCKQKDNSETAFLSHLYIKTIILPRQARDKHREIQKRMPFFGRFLQGLGGRFEQVRAISLYQDRLGTNMCGKRFATTLHSPTQCVCLLNDSSHRQIRCPGRLAPGQ